MSRARHNTGGTIKRASGGGVPDKVSGNPNVFKEAMERKNGGRAERKYVGFWTGGAVKSRADRPARKSGGRVGANNAPFTTAKAVTAPATLPKSQVGKASS